MQPKNQCTSVKPHLPLIPCPVCLKAHAYLLFIVLCNGKGRKFVFCKPVKAGGLDVFLEASAGDVAEGEDLADTVCVVGSVVPFPVVNGDDAVDFGGKTGLLTNFLDGVLADGEKKLAPAAGK